MQLNIELNIQLKQHRGQQVVHELKSMMMKLKMQSGQLVELEVKIRKINFHHSLPKDFNVNRLQKLKTRRNLKINVDNRIWLEKLEIELEIQILKVEGQNQRWPQDLLRIPVELIQFANLKVEGRKLIVMCSLSIIHLLQHLIHMSNLHSILELLIMLIQLWYLIIQLWYQLIQPA